MNKVKWDQAHLETYLKNWEVIDTALIPVIRVALGNGAEESINRAAWVYGVASHLEEQLAGRIILIPAIPYAQSAEQAVNFLASFSEDIKQKATNVIYLTAEKELEEANSGSQIKLITIQLTGEEREKPSTQDLFNLAQKYISSLIRLWQKG